MLAPRHHLSWAGPAALLALFLIAGLAFYSLYSSRVANGAAQLDDSMRTAQTGTAGLLLLTPLLLAIPVAMMFLMRRRERSVDAY